VKVDGRWAVDELVGVGDGDGDEAEGRMRQGRVMSGMKRPSPGA
jgi:hypothetical protein